MPRFLNTDNGQIVEVAHHEAIIYEAASNFVPAPDPSEATQAPNREPVAAASPAPKRRAPKKKV